MARTPIGREPAVGSFTPSNKRDYKLTNRLQVGEQPIYAVVFNFIDPRLYNVFAAVGGNQITIYGCMDGGSIAVQQLYDDDDKAESFYTVSWACDIDTNPFIVAGGSNGVMRVIDAGKGMIHKNLVGHGGSINEIRTQALRPSLVLSASKDESVRLWNVHTGICVLIFAGAAGHRNEVLSVDFHPTDEYRIASCGMDGTVKIWSMKEFWKYILRSFSWTDHPSKFPTKFIQFPIHVASVHTNYVDCTRWLGDFVLSKSVGNEVLRWYPQIKEQSPGKGSTEILMRYPIPECDIWFIKFSCDYYFNTAAVGNRKGKIYIWELRSCPPALVSILSHPHSKSPIRQTAMSYDGSTVLAGSDDGSICRWDACSATDRPVQRTEHLEREMTTHVPHVSYNALMILDFPYNGFPSEVSSFLVAWEDTRADGHCGFRAIAVSLGLTQDDWVEVRKCLYNELLTHMMDTYMPSLSDEARKHLADRVNYFHSPALPPHWFDTDCALIAAGAYYAVVVHLSDTGHCCTYLPMRRQKKHPLIPQIELWIHNIKGEHYLAVTMEPNSPLPPLDPSWPTNRHNSVCHLQDYYNPRFLMWSRL